MLFRGVTTPLAPNTTIQHQRLKLHKIVNIEWKIHEKSNILAWHTSKLLLKLSLLHLILYSQISWYF